LKKGQSGNVVTIVVSIVIAILAIVLLWIIFNDLVKGLATGVSDLMISIKCSLCDKIGIFKNMGRMCKVCS
jgi:uncharacterized membrane protein